MEEIDLKDLFNMFWGRKAQIILIILIFITIGIIYTIGFTTPKYDSSTTLVLASSGDTNTNTAMIATEITVNSKLVSTYSELIKSKNVLREVSDNLGIEINEEILKNNVSVRAVKNTELIEIIVEHENATYAMQIANEIAKVFTQKVKEIYNIDNVQIVDEAEIESEPSNINHMKDVVVFSMIGIVVAIAFVLIASMLDTTVKTAEDIETNFNVLVLASIPVIENLENERKNKR